MSTMQTMNRRQFILGATGVSLVALGAGVWQATRQPTINFVENERVHAGATSRILVTYASQYGSTGGVADAIGEAFYAAGSHVDVRQVENVTDLSPYTAVVVGGPVITEAWMEPSVAFVNTHQQTLSQLPTAYFLTCMTLGLTTDEVEHAKILRVFPAVLQQVPAVQPVEVGLFAGALDYNKMSAVNSRLYKLFSPDTTDGDYRDWDAIRAWATALYPRLM